RPTIRTKRLNSPKSWCPLGISVFFSTFQRNRTTGVFVVHVGRCLGNLRRHVVFVVLGKDACSHKALTVPLTLQHSTLALTEEIRQQPLITHGNTVPIID